MRFANTAAGWRGSPLRGTPAVIGDDVDHRNRDDEQVWSLYCFSEVLFLPCPPFVRMRSVC